MRTTLFAVALVASSSFLIAAAGCGGSTSNDNPDSGMGGEQDSGTMHADTGTPANDSGTSEGGGQDSGTGPLVCTPFDAGAPTAGYPAAHAPLPTVTYQGAGILQTPEVVTVTFPGDTYASQLEQFGDDILQSCWWDEARAGLCTGASGAPPCVGQGMTATGGHVQMTTAPASSYTDSQTGGAASLKTFVQQQVASGAFPAPTPGTIYAMYFPASTSVTLDGNTSCQTFGGYHMSTMVTPPNGMPTNAAYAVIPRCMETGFSTQLDELTFAASHEIAEASSDPFAAGNNAGFYLDFSNLDNVPWNFVGGGEIGDLCVDLLGQAGVASPHDRITAVGSHGSYLAQRLWNLPAAAAGGDPCAPQSAPDEPYFNVAIAQGKALQMGVAVGSTVMIEADAFSTAPMAKWSFFAVELAALTNPSMSHLTITPGQTSPTTVGNGDKVMISITVNSATAPVTQGGALYLLISQSGQTAHLWPGIISSP